jgi:methylmalonyl-CoA/ethylmalonyl-CoA epimerase
MQAAFAAAKAAGVPLEGEPHVIYRDEAGTFGPAGSEEWMAFLRDPSGNLVGLVETRLAH